MADHQHPEPLLDELGQLIVEGRDAASYLWQVPDDDSVRGQIVELLVSIKEKGTAEGRHEMPALCDELSIAGRASASPQQVEILQDGFDRLYKLWRAAKSGLM